MSFRKTTISVLHKLASTSRDDVKHVRLKATATFCPEKRHLATRRLIRDGERGLRRRCIPLPACLHEIMRTNLSLSKRIGESSPQLNDRRRHSTPKHRAQLHGQRSIARPPTFLGRSGLADICRHLHCRKQPEAAEPSSIAPTRLDEHTDQCTPRVQVTKTQLRAHFNRVKRDQEIECSRKGFSLSCRRTPIRPSPKRGVKPTCVGSTTGTRPINKLYAKWQASRYDTRGDLRSVHFTLFQNVSLTCMLSACMMK